MLWYGLTADLSYLAAKTPHTFVHRLYTYTCKLHLHRSTLRKYNKATYMCHTENKLYEIHRHLSYFQSSDKTNFHHMTPYDEYFVNMWIWESYRNSTDDIRSSTTPFLKYNIMLILNCKWGRAIPTSLSPGFWVQEQNLYETTFNGIQSSLPCITLSTPTVLVKNKYLTYFSFSWINTHSELHLNKQVQQFSCFCGLLKDKQS